MSRIALGTMTFGGSGTAPWNVIGGLDLKAADELVGIALDQGVNLIDTADMYASGETEEILGKILKGRRRDVVLATKAYSRMGAGPNEVGLSRLHLRNAIDDSLRRLGTDHIDLYQIHAHDHLTPLDETLAALDDAVRQGKISYVGTSNTYAWQLAKALGVADLRGYPRFVSLQAYYSLVGRDLERELLPLVNEEKLGLLVYSPLAGGFLSGKFTRDSQDASGRRAQADNPPLDRERGYDIVDALRKVAERHDVGVARVALAWVLAQRGVTSVIVGAKRPDQLHENLAAVDLELTGQDLAELDAVSALPLEYPAWALNGAYPSRTP
ncbi:aldo/keto reductase [Amycolatopsis sp. NPDC051372]|uniref:aldo/keto reductase n=1 Tax=Amycolatopsis sp. NPDC051372 TaxID=3155669 RepID=UPI0034163BD7